MDNNNSNENQQPTPFEFGNLDAIMMMLMYGATNLIDRNASIAKQAAAIAEFNAKFMALRVAHEEQHITAHSPACPYCSALKLNEHLHRGA